MARFENEPGSQAGILVFVLRVAFGIFAAAVLVSLGVTESSPLPNVTIPELVAPYLVIQAVVATWTRVSDRGRWALLVLSVLFLGVYGYFLSWVALVGVVFGTVVAIVGWLLPFESVTRWIVARVSTGSDETFECSAADRDTLVYHQDTDRFSPRGTIEDAKTCPDCGVDLDQFLVSTSCPNCGFLFEEPR